MVDRKREKMLWGTYTNLHVVPIPYTSDGGLRLDKMRRNFLWQGNKEKKGYDLLKWKKIVKSKSQGALCI